MAKTGTVRVNARHVRRPIEGCASLAEARGYFPELSPDAYRGLRRGTHTVVDSGVNQFDIVTLEEMRQRVKDAETDRADAHIPEW